jgi:hypothetical protein
MRAFTTVLMILAGLACIATGTAAWAQQNYVCQYNCFRACGIDSCYPAVQHCDDRGQGNRNYLVQDSTIFGSCTPGGNASCTVKTYPCNNQGYNIPDCSSGCCLITTYVTYCKC